MELKRLLPLAPALALGVLGAMPAMAQQHRATRLGNPATRFHRPLKKPDELRVFLRGEKVKADVASILNQYGWKGSLDDLDRAAASAEISEVKIPTGTRLPFMASRKNRKPVLLNDVLWAGAKPIDAYTFEFASNCVRYRLVAPKVCSNFWIEDLGKDDTDPKCAPPPKPPVVSVVASPAEAACVTQPVAITVNVQNPPADGKVSLAVNGKELAAGTLTAGSYQATFPGAPTPGTYEVTATSGGVSSSTRVTVKPCLPTCNIAVAPLPPKAGKPTTIDVSGSHVAEGVRGGVKSARVEVVREGTVVDTLDMTAPNLVNNAYVFKKGGAHTVRAVVTDEAGQSSTNTCETGADVKGGFPIFVGGYFGKERLTHDEEADHDDLTPFAPFSRCAPLAGFEIGVQPKISDNAEFEAALGVKFPFEDDAHTALFADAAVNRVASRGFFGGGVSWWDIGRDSTGVGLLLQGGFDLDKDGKWQLVGQTRVPFFNQFDNIENNYQFWGGIRFKPNSWK